MLIKKSLKNLILVFLVIIYSCERDQPVFGENGMVVSTSSQASQVGIDIMKAGGNAIDAAAAVGFALAVTSSSNGNIGGYSDKGGIEKKIFLLKSENVKI